MANGEEENGKTTQTLLSFRRWVSLSSHFISRHREKVMSNDAIQGPPGRAWNCRSDDPALVNHRFAVACSWAEASYCHPRFVLPPILRLAMRGYFQSTHLYRTKPTGTRRASFYASDCFMFMQSK